MPNHDKVVVKIYSSGRTVTLQGEDLSFSVYWLQKYLEQFWLCDHENFTEDEIQNLIKELGECGFLEQVQNVVDKYNKGEMFEIQVYSEV